MKKYEINKITFYESEKNSVYDIDVPDDVETIEFNQPIVRFTSNKKVFKSIKKIYFGKDVKSIGRGTLSQKRFPSLEFVSVKALGQFYDIADSIEINTVMLDFPDVVDFIVDSVLTRNSLIENIKLMDNHPHYSEKDGIIYTKDMKMLIYCPLGHKSEVVIPEGVERISDEAFYCSMITKVTLPDSLKHIGIRAFSQCKHLNDIDFGHGIKHIGSTVEYDTFTGCTALKRLYIPPQVKSIGVNAFSYCVGIEEVNFSEGLEEIMPGAFCSNYYQDEIGLRRVVLPKSLMYVNENNFKDVPEVVVKEDMPTGLIISIAKKAFKVQRCKYVHLIMEGVDDFLVPAGLNYPQAKTIENEIVTYKNKRFMNSLYKFVYDENELRSMYELVIWSYMKIGNLDAKDILEKKFTDVIKRLRNPEYLEKLFSLDIAPDNKELRKALDECSDNAIIKAYLLKKINEKGYLEEDITV